MEAQVEDQDVQLQKTLVEMEIINTEKRELMRKIEFHREEIIKILDEVEQKALVDETIRQGGIDRMEQIVDLIQGSGAL